MIDHMWVSLQYTPLEVTKNDDGTLKVEATEAAIEAAVSGSIFSCWFCHTLLATHTFETECSGPTTS